MNLREEMIVSLLFFGVGALFSLIGFSLLFETLRFVRTAVRTQGRVVGYHNSKGRGDGPGQITYQHPEVKFEDQHGHMQRATMAMGNDHRRYTEGAAVPLLFDPKNPCDARIATYSNLWSFPLKFTLGGLAGIGVAFGVWLWPPG